MNHDAVALEATRDRHGNGRAMSCTASATGSRRQWSSRSAYQLRRGAQRALRGCQLAAVAGTPGDGGTSDRAALAVYARACRRGVDRMMAVAGRASGARPRRRARAVSGRTRRRRLRAAHHHHPPDGRPRPRTGTLASSRSILTARIERPDDSAISRMDCPCAYSAPTCAAESSVPSILGRSISPPP